MATTAIILFCTFSVTTILSSDTTWFKNTQFHDANVVEIQNGWIDCPDWKPAISTNIGFSMNTSIFSTSTTATDNHTYNFTAKCIAIQVPLIWNEDDLHYMNHTNYSAIDTIDYFITRIYSSFNQNNTENNGAFWMINGGPGIPGTQLYPTAIPWLTFINSTFDLYIPDHRGSGSSNPLSCPSQIMTSAPNCTRFLDDTYGDDIHYFSPYSASMDLGYAIGLFMNNWSVYNDNRTIIYGYSYGTYYLNQYLHFFPDQVNGVIFDGLCPPDKCKLSQFDKNTNAVSIKFLDLCDKDEFCGEQFNKSVIDTLHQIFQRMNNDSNISSTTCYDNLILTDIAKWKAILFQLLANFDQRVLIPPIIHRLQRCNADDITALNTLLAGYEGFTVESFVMLLTGVTGHNIIVSEMWFGSDPTNPGLSYDEFIAAEKEYYISTGLGSMLRRWWGYWNKYEPNPDIYNKYANPSMPMLLLNGDLDPQTHVKWALHAGRQYGANINDNTHNPLKRYYYTVPNAVHSVMFQSRIVNYTDNTIDLDDDYEACGFYIMASFIDGNRNFVPDNKCIDWLTPIDWKGEGNITQQLSQKLMGTNDMWGLQFGDDNVSKDSVEFVHLTRIEL
eukprot:75761_1